MEAKLQKLILFLIDGLRPDGLAKAHTPVIDELIAYGASTMAARSVRPSITLPCITSLFLGTPPEVHGITSNMWTAMEPDAGLFEVVAQAGRRAASFYNWEPLRDLSRPGHLHTALFLKGDTEPEGHGDTALAEFATAYLVRARREQTPIHFTFIYLGYTDTAGHAHGWMSPPYLRAIENADACIGRVLRALEEEYGGDTGLDEGLPRCCGVIVASDHGGHDTHHGTEEDTDMTVPLVLYGHPAFTPGQEIPGPVTLTDIAPTAAAWMGLDAPAAWVGRALTP